jgi:hypothetical protein
MTVWYKPIKRAINTTALARKWKEKRNKANNERGGGRVKTKRLCVSDVCAVGVIVLLLMVMVMMMI